MSGTNRPLATYSDKSVIVYGYVVERTGGVGPEGFSGAAKNINAAVTARERKAAAKALRAFADSEALKDDFGHGEVITKHDVRTALRAEADSVEKGER